MNILLNRRSLLLNCLCTLLLLTSLPLAQANQTIVDSSGLEIQVVAPFKRIISLYSGHTENICSLGAQEQLVGISRSDDFPASVTELRRYSYREDPEKFIAAGADLVLVRPMIERSYPEFIKKLKNAGIAVISLQPKGVEEMFDYWHSLGILTGKVDNSRKMVNQFQTGIANIKSSLSDIPQEVRPKVYFESIHSKMKTFAPESIAIYVLEQAGGVNIGVDAPRVRKTNIAYYGKERLLSHGQDIDFFLAQQGRMNPVTLEIIYNEPGFKAIKAVREKKVHLIAESLVARPTLRILEGIIELNHIFYP